MLRHVTQGASVAGVTINAPSAGLIASAHRSRGESDLSIQTRAAMGLTTSGPIIMTGHQAGLWHAGILAKYIYSNRVAARMRGSLGSSQWAHVVVDQDVNDAASVSYPTTDVRRETLRLAPFLPGTPTCRAPSIKTVIPPDSAALPAVTRAWERVGPLLIANAHHPNIARQWAGVLSSLLTPLAPGGVAIFASDLSQTPGFAAVLTAMAADGERCVWAYNAAAAATPRARIAPLRMSAHRAELPLWRISGSSRHPVYSDELMNIDHRELAPRALMLTAFMRLFACDLFVHGLGGGIYDQITDAWIKAWRPAWTLAPTAVVTATLHLPFPDATGLATPEAIARAAWEYHRARHDPALLGDAGSAAAKQELLTRIRSLRESGAPARGAYLDLHKLLEEARTRGTARLEAIKSHAHELAASSERAGVVFDRTWPFVYHSEASLAGLASEIEAAIKA